MRKTSKKTEAFTKSQLVTSASVIVAVAAGVVAIFAMTFWVTDESSVAGLGHDPFVGIVIERNGNLLTIQTANLIVTIQVDDSSIVQYAAGGWTSATELVAGTRVAVFGRPIEGDILRADIVTILGEGDFTQ